MAMSAVVVVAGCSDSGEPDSDRLAEELIQETDGALDDDQATCVAEALVGSFGEESFRAVTDAAAGDGDARDDVRVEVIDIFSACDALDAVVLEENRADEAD